MKLTVIIVAYNSRDDLSDCLRAILDSRLTEAEIVVVDNASADDSVALVRSCFPAVRVLRSETNLGFGGAINFAVPQTQGDVIVVLNPDVTVNPDCITSLIDWIDRDADTGVVGAKLLYPGSSIIQHAGGLIAYPLALASHYGYGQDDLGQYDVPRDVDYVTGAVFAIKRSVLMAVGGFDEGFYPAYYEETDLCYRVRRAGYRVVYVPQAVALHHESRTTGRDSATYFRFFHRNRLRYVLKHYDDDQILQDFWMAEFERLRSLESTTEVSALAAAYEDNLAIVQRKSTLLSNRTHVESLPITPVRIQMLQSLAAGAGQWNDVLIRQAQTARLEDPIEKIPKLPLFVEQIRQHSHICEPDFRSGLPVVGRAIVSVRRFWNWMSTKWYVRSVIQQQNAFNAAVADAVSEIEDEIRELRDVQKCLSEQARTAANVVKRVKNGEDLGIDLDCGVTELRREIALIDVRLRQFAERLEAIDRDTRKTARLRHPDRAN